MKNIVHFIRNHAVRRQPHQGDNAAIREWSTDLQDIAHRLDSMVASSEKTFLSLGENLKEFYERAQDICSKSNDMVGIMSGEGFSKAIEGLSAILNELKEFIGSPGKSFTKTIDVFNEHLTTLKKVSSSLEEIDMIVLNLSMLGFLTRVENAHIRTSNTGFASLTEDVRLLAETIKQKSLQINSKSDSVLSFISYARGKVADYKTTRHEQMNHMLKKTTDNHKSLTNKYAATSRSARLIEQGTRNIASSMGDIVMSMQFHDITRQQIEHVKEVTENLYAKINDKGHSIEEVSAFVRDVCDLQHAQIRQSKEELTTAVKKIIENLHAIGASVGEIKNMAENAAMSSGTEGVSFMEEIDAGISSIIKSIRDSSDEQAKITDTVNSASEMVSEMSGFVRDIESMGMNLQLIALNARIKAAHLGREGAVLDTLSGDIYDLSKNAHEDTRRLIGMLGDLVILSKTFREDYQGMQEGQSHTVECIVEDLKGLISSLQEMDRTVLAMLTELSWLGNSLMKDIERVADGINIHKELEAILEEVIGGVLNVAKRAWKISPAGHIDTTSSFFTDIDKLYTMESEREVHMRQIQGSDLLPGKDKPIKPADELDENVELF